QHLPPKEHCNFYNSQKYTLNVTRQDMIKAGYSPSVRLFEAAACGVPVISDFWEGLEEFFEFDKEILVADTAEEVLRYWDKISDAERIEIGEAARKMVLKKHTSAVRAGELETYINHVLTTSQKI